MESGGAGTGPRPVPHERDCVSGQQKTPSLPASHFHLLLSTHGPANQHFPGLGCGAGTAGPARACPTPPCLSFPFAPPTHSSQQIAATQAPDQPLLTGPGAPGALNRGPQAHPALRRPPHDSPLRRPNADPPTAAPAHRGAARPRPRPRRLRGRSRLRLGFILRRRVNYRGWRGEK